MLTALLSCCTAALAEQNTASHAHIAETSFPRELQQEEPLNMESPRRHLCALATTIQDHQITPNQLDQQTHELDMTGTMVATGCTGTFYRLRQVYPNGNSQSIQSSKGLQIRYVPKSHCSNLIGFVVHGGSYGDYYRVVECVIGQEDGVTKPDAIVRIVIYRNIPRYGHGSWTWTADLRIKVVDNTLPRLEYASDGINKLSIKYWQNPVSVLTPILTTTAYDSADYQHELYAVPDGRWHWTSCVTSASAVQNCLNGDFSKYRLTSAIFEDSKRFSVQFEVKEYEMTWDAVARFLHVVRDSTGNLVTYNWDASWLIMVQDQNQQFLQQGDLTTELADQMSNGPFNLNNYNTQDWPIFKSIKYKGKSTIPDDFTIPWPQDIMQVNNPLYGQLEHNFHTSECFQKGYVKSIDRPTMKITIDPVVCFDSATSWKSCQLAGTYFPLNQKWVNSSSVLDLKLGFGPCDYKSPLAATTGINWKSDVKVVYIELFQDFTVAPFDLSGVDTGCSEGRTVKLTGKVGAFSLTETNTAGEYLLYLLYIATPGIYEFQINVSAKYVMHKDVEGLTPTLKVDVRTLLTPEFLEMVITAKEPKDLIQEIPQDKTQCDPGSCPALIVHTLQKKSFEIILGKAIKEVVQTKGQFCDLCQEKMRMGTLSVGRDISNDFFHNRSKMLQAEAENLPGGPQTAQVPDWNSVNHIETKCGSWTTADQGVTKTQKITVNMAQQPLLKTDITVSCVFAPCSNFKAQSVGDFAPKIAGGSVKEHKVDFWVISTLVPTAIKLQKFETWCPSHTAVHHQISGTVKQYNKPDIALDETNIKSFGITLEADEKFDQLLIFTENRESIGQSFQIQVQSFAVEEPEYKFTEKITLNYVDGSCPLTQYFLDSYPPQVIELRTSRAGKSVTASIQDAMQRGQEALQESRFSFYCGTIVSEFHDLGGEQPFIKVNFTEHQIKVEPELEYAAGFYNKASIRMYYDRYPSLYFDIFIHSTIDNCIIESAEFKPDKLSFQQWIGKDDTLYKLPKFSVKPACNLTIASYDFEQSRKDRSLLEFDSVQNILVVKKTEDLTLYGKRVSATLSVYTEEYDRPLLLSIDVIYNSNGPEFRGQDSITFPEIPCSANGLNWSFQMPDVVSQESQEVQIDLIQDQLIGDLFRFNQTSKVVSLRRMFKDQIVQGKGCPIGKDVVLTFQITSSVIGISRNAFILEFAEDKDSNWQGGELSVSQDDQLKSKNDIFALAEKVSAEIDSISRTGELTIRFSQPLRATQDISLLGKVQSGRKQKSLEVIILPIEGQTQESIGFSWTAENFDGQALTLKLSFDHPYDISTHGEQNSVDITLNEVGYFVRQSDGWSLSDQLNTSKKIPKQIQPDLEASIKAAAQMVSSTGKSSLIVMMVLSNFMEFGMNSLLGQVRSLSYITHYMIMQLNYAAEVTLFYSYLFEFVTFDMVPTDEIYSSIFHFDSEPYSQEADDIGYSSSLFIENTGTLLIYCFLIAIQFSFIYLIKRFLNLITVLRKWANRKSKSFLWAGAIEFQDQLYLCVAVSLGLNYGSFSFESVAMTLNSLYAIAFGVLTLVTPPVIVVKLYRMLDKKQGEKQKSHKRKQNFEGGESEANPNLMISPELDGSPSKTDVGSPSGTDQSFDQQEQENIQAPQASFTSRKKINKDLKKELEKIARKEKKDQKIRKKFGGQVKALAHRGRLPVKALLFFVSWMYARRLFLVIIILSLYYFPSIQIVLTMHLSLLQVVIIFTLRPYATAEEQRMNSSNEIVAHVSLIFLCLFAGQFTSDRLQLVNISQMIIIVTVLNFSINGLLILFTIFLTFRKKIKRLILKRRKRQLQARKLAALRMRTPQEQEFSRRITMRANLAEENQAKFKSLERQHMAGDLDDHQVASKIQQHLNLEQQLDSDAESPREAQEALQAANHSFDIALLNLGSQRLVEKQAALRDNASIMEVTLTKRFTQLPSFDDIEIFEQESSKNDSLGKNQNADQRGNTKVDSVLGELEECTESESQTFMIRTDQQTDQESKKDKLSKEVQSACDIQVFIQEVNQKLDQLLESHQTKLELKFSGQAISTAESQKACTQQTINAWLDILAEAFSGRLVDIDELSEQAKQSQVSQKDLTEIQQKLLKGRLQFSDIYFEVIDIQQEEGDTNDSSWLLDRDIKLATFAAQNGFSLPPTFTSQSEANRPIQ